MWDIEMYLEKAPENHANTIDIAIMDKEKKKWLLLEGTVCTVEKVWERNNNKQEKYRELRTGIKQLYPGYGIVQVNLVFDFLGNYHQYLNSTTPKKLTIY